MGIKFGAKIKTKHNYKRFNSVASKLSESVTDGFEDLLNNIRGYAIRLERGHNSEGILCEMVDMSTKKVKGRVYADPGKFMTDNNESYLFFEYFGTGSFAEMEHIGTTKHFVESGYTEWYIPVNKVDRSLNYPIKTIGNQQFYVAHGAKANHFLTDAEFESRSENIEIVRMKIEEMLKEVCK